MICGRSPQTQEDHGVRIVDLDEQARVLESLEAWLRMEIE
jgi:hypothetical protein